MGQFMIELGQFKFAPWDHVYEPGHKSERRNSRSDLSKQTFARLEEMEAQLPSTPPPADTRVQFALAFAHRPSPDP